MAHNWQPNLNFDAPEFVPKFGPPMNGGNQQQQQQNAGPRNMNNNNAGGPMQGQQYRQPSQGGPFYQQQSLPPQQQQQQHYQNQQQQQPYRQQNQQQQQPHFQQQQGGYSQYQQTPYQQQQQQQPFYQTPQNIQQQPFNNLASKINPVQQQSNPTPAAAAETVKVPQINQVTNDLAAVSLTLPPTAAPKVKETPVVAESALTPVKEVEKAAKPVPPKTDVPTPSVDVESSAEPSVATIKEDEEWGEEDGLDADEDDDAVTEKEAEGEGAEERPRKKKQIVIREYKAKKEPINVIFCGHVDAGKSTIGGQIMFLTGMVDKRTLEKYEREAKEKNRESWYLSWALDTNTEEREKGKTVEVGRAFFETEKKHFIILDAPGHKGFVPNMIGGASQADIAVLVISARRGEFETGFEKGGQTREHAMLVKTAGVKYLVVLVNKMDDPTVNWDEARYIEIKDKLLPYLKKCGFNPGKDMCFMPCSGYTGAFIKEPLDESICPWYRAPCFIEFLDALPTLNRSTNGPLRMPLIDKYRDMGTVVMGKIESGMVKLNDKLVLMPNKVKVEVTNIYCEDEETDSAICGENVKLKLKGIEEEEISSGFVLCDPKDTCHVANVFDAQVIILECPSIISPGFNSIMHMHSCTVEVQLKAIIAIIDKKTGDKNFTNPPRFIKQDQIAICRFEILNGAVCCMEPFKMFPQLGRFTLRYESKSVAVGKVLKIIESTATSAASKQ